MSTKIEWAGETWNPVTGCTRVSDGCDHCYAVTMSRRLAAMGQKKYAGLVNPGKKHFNGVVKCHEEALGIPLMKRKPTTWFVNSMSDLFHDGVPFEFIDRVFCIMKAARQHTFQILTKRPERMAEYFSVGRPAILDDAYLQMMNDGYGLPSIICYSQHNGIEGWPLPNVWIGTSVENQKAADERIPHLLKVPAAVRFLSCEPLLGPVSLTNMDVEKAGDKDWCWINALTGRHTDMCRPCPDVPTIDWVIAGGESGHGARPMQVEWCLSLMEQCEAAGVAFFMKQGSKANWVDYKDITSFPERLQKREFPKNTRL